MACSIIQSANTMPVLKADAGCRECVNIAKTYGH